MMMLPTLPQISTERYKTPIDSYSLSSSGNYPEENDETASSDSLLDAHSEPFSSTQSWLPMSSQHQMADADHHRVAGTQSCYNPFRQSMAQHLHSSYQSHFHSPMEECCGCLDMHAGAWPSISFSSGCGSSGANPNSLASCPPSEHYMSYQRQDCTSQSHASSPAVGSYSLSISHLEPPLSLHSLPPTGTANPFVQSYPCRPPACCPQYPVDEFSMQPSHPPGYHLPRTPGAPCCRPPGIGTTQRAHTTTEPSKTNGMYSRLLPLEQRKVFVTYEADSEMHVREILHFVSLLRGNGFDTHIDQFEQQYRSISKIDFMEKYISEKDYLIIIVISPKYYETVKPCQYNNIKNDESALHTVYIYKQLQNEYIQNGSKNFRFIPVLFPGAKRSHVPSWLQNTHVYHWPQDMQDILLRLMRVEKYNPPPVGKLPTIFSKRI
ncbi:uncharacterized protein LOC121327902 [Polyodon spathula]|uniref:uncharacterized protein LOC121327902 n=1 Tax=Polyodon spathula TaxID=7913 RepID=UPI001B7DDE88|nr:uncharacterized protein LOC121327902 [Polyodon spathula]